MKSVAVPESMDDLTNRNFGARILRMDRSHDKRPLRSIDMIRHTLRPVSGANFSAARTSHAEDNLLHHPVGSPRGCILADSQA